MERTMRRRLFIRKRIQRSRLTALRKAMKHGAGLADSRSYNAYLISAGLTDPFQG